MLKEVVEVEEAQAREVEVEVEKEHHAPKLKVELAICGSITHIMAASTVA